MRRNLRALWAGTIIFLLGGICSSADRSGAGPVKPAASSVGAAENNLPSVVLREAPLIQMPGVEVPERSLLHEADSNNPLHWDGDVLYLFNNYGHPWRTSGPDIEHLGKRISVDLGFHNND